MNATYSPDDNKLRLYSSSRLDAETYARVKAHGFKWAPKQGLFVAPMWTPEREELLVELCGEVGDEDTSLTERQEERAERFEGYQEKRKAEAEQAQESAHAISERFAGGQPILVGHHSERKARKDHERMDNQMRKTIQLWETSAYWRSRAAGAIRHAKYKELPAVRARRIKGIEADLRKAEKYIKEAELHIAMWTDPEKELTLERAQALSNLGHLYWESNYTHPSGYVGPVSIWDMLRTDREGEPEPRITPEQAREKVIKVKTNTIARQALWVNHYKNRLEYERAMLAEAGGLVSDQHKFEVGGQVLRRYGQWFIITKVNPQSVSVIGHFAGTIPFDEIKDYKPPKPGDAEKVKKATKIPPICNYPGEGFKHMTQAELKADKSRQWYDSPKTRIMNGNETYGIHRVQLTRGEQGSWRMVPAFITDMKRKDPPPPTGRELPAREATAPREPVVYQEDEDQKRIQALKQTQQALKDSPVIVGDQLFPTPLHLCVKMVQLAEIEPGHHVLEPSAGTGNILKSLPCVRPQGSVTAVEWLQAARKGLEPWADEVHTEDFLSMNGSLGTFDRILMNPPFKNREDIKHILHAKEHLAPGGRLVALCANGPRQQAQLKPLASHWEDLPAGSFKEAGTNVNVALLVIEN